MSKGFTVEADSPGCEKCGHGATWHVVDPNGIAGSTGYFDKEDADECADLLNQAYELGKLAAIAEELGDGWQPIESAPKDGTNILLRVRHRNWTVAGADRERWQEDVVARWITVNDVEDRPCGAGWTWSGMMGEPVAWKAVEEELATGGGNTAG